MTIVVNNILKIISIEPAAEIYAAAPAPAVTQSVSERSEEMYRRVNSGTTSLGHVYINPTQYFDHVPERAWHFYIGGYQPAQKWLKDRKGRTLSIDDILHYQRVIVALSETDRVMGEVDEVIRS